MDTKIANQSSFCNGRPGIDKYKEEDNVELEPDNDIKYVPQTDESASNTPDVRVTTADHGLPIDRGWAWVVLGGNGDQMVYRSALIEYKFAKKKSDKPPLHPYRIEHYVDLCQKREVHSKMKGTVFYLFLFGGVKKNFGIIFVAIQTQFNADASVVSLLMTLQNLLMSVSSLLVMTIGMHYMSGRTSVAIGTVCMSTAFVVNAYAKDIRILFATFAVEGIGSAMVLSPVRAILVEYFETKRGLSNGIAFSGASLGGLTFAPIMSSLFEYYGYRGTCMIVAGMLLNILVTASLLRPLKSFERPNLSKIENSNDENIYTETAVNKPLMLREMLYHSSEPMNLHMKQTEGPARRTRNKQIVHSINSSSEQSNNVAKIEHNYIEISPKTSDMTDHMSPLMPRVRSWSDGAKRQQTMSDAHPATKRPWYDVMDTLTTSRIAMYGGSTADFVGSAIDLPQIYETNKPEDKTEMQESLKYESCFQNWFKPFKTALLIMFDFSLFRNPVFLLCLLMSAMNAPPSGLMVVCLVPYAKDLGLSSTQRGALLSVVGVVGLFFRLTLAIFSDKKIIKLTTLLAATALTSGILVQCTRFFTEFPTLIVFAVILGMTCELYQAIYSVVLVEYLTLKRLKSSLGFTIMCQYVSVAVTFPAVGWLRDVTGNYLASYHLLGTMSFVGALSVLLIPIVHKRQKETNQETIEL